MSVEQLHAPVVAMHVAAARAAVEDAATVPVGVLDRFELSEARPLAWCEVHHPHAWSEGGRTSLENALPLCGYHHRRAHDDRFILRRLPSGEVRFRRGR